MSLLPEREKALGHGRSTHMKALLCGALAATCAVERARPWPRTRSRHPLRQRLRRPWRRRKWEPVLAAFMAAQSRHRSEVGERRRLVAPRSTRTCCAPRWRAAIRPDVFFLWGGSIAKPFINAGQVEPIDSGLRREGLGRPLPGLDRRSPEAGRQALRRALPRPGHGPLLPQGPVRGGRRHRADHLRRTRGRACTKLKSKPNIYCASTGGKFGWHVMRLVDYFLETACGPGSA
jgi:hypothetical protein